MCFVFFNASPDINHYTDFRLAAKIKDKIIVKPIVGNTIADHSVVVGASPVGAASTTSSLST